MTIQRPNQSPALLDTRWGHTWLGGPRLYNEAAERRAREERIQKLLPQDEEDSGAKVYDARLTRRLLRYLIPYRTHTLWAVVLMSLSSLLHVAGPWLIGQAIDQVQLFLQSPAGAESARVQALSQLQWWTLLFIGAALAEWGTNLGRIQLMAYAGTKVVADMRSELFRHLHKLSLNFHNNYSVGRLMSRLISDVGILQDFVTWSITGLARSGFILVGTIVAMLLLNWQLALVTFALLPLMLWLTEYWRVRVRTAYRATRIRLALINGYLNESISGIRVTQSFTREARNFRHFDDLNRSFFDANIDATWLMAIFFPGVDLLGSLATALVIGVGGWLVFGDSLTAGTLVAFVLYVDRFFEPIRELAQRYNTFQATMTGCERVFHLLDTAPDLQDAPHAYPLPPIAGRVEFEEVAFWYKADTPVLRSIDLHAAPGERVALVGETGAGKSTVIRLLARFFDVSGGVVKIDGHDIRQVTMASLRSQLGIVLQDTFLFSGPLLENIRYGRLDASDEEVIAAAKAVGAHDFIIKLPEGYQTAIEENGSNLSVGQRQILSFARALLADPRILILDEATSSVDTATEKVIDSALDHLMQGRTSFVIAHRLSTIVNADKIVVMDKGQIVELGNHAELLAQQGRYYHLYTMQWAAQEEASVE
ncbi:MAG: ABC transporter ATP-binding protein [Caldilineaceae bacterium]|nr:ABC transporter ATP-binding protein [Caldilineaceae bacterium]